MNISQVVLIILDGWGYSDDKEYNAVEKAPARYFNSLFTKYPHTLFPASGESVGLPKGIIGTSEIGHSVIGTGRILYTDIVKINTAITSGEFNKNEAILEAINHTLKNESTLHLIGLLSPGGVHSHQEHLYALLRLAKEKGVQHVAVHIITDGRDTPPQSAKEYVNQLEEVMKSVNIGRVASISGRYYSMDRDKNEDRTLKATSLLFAGVGDTSPSASEALEKNYEKSIHDEFIIPTNIVGVNSEKTVISKNDSIVFFNFRPDRARQLSKSIADKKKEMNLCFVTFTQYDPTIDSLVAFPPTKITATLSSEVSKAGLTQTHIAETEKYAHVTYFLNGGEEKEHNGEKFVLIPSRKDIPTHDLAPHMKAEEIASSAIHEIEKGTNLIVLNFANADMVGHTGKMEAALQAVAFEDTQIQRVVEATLKNNGVVFITADHGNAEKMFDTETNQPYTAHTLNPVPAILTLANGSLHEGTLADVTPTILTLLGIPVPGEMTGKNIYSQTQ